MLTKGDLYEAAMGALSKSGVINLTGDGGAYVLHEPVVDTILRTIVEKTASPRTCEEITRVLEER